MLNPNLFTPGYRRAAGRYTKFYFGIAFNRDAILPMRRKFRTAVEALDYARKVHARYCRMYEKALLVMAAA